MKVGDLVYRYQDLSVDSKTIVIGLLIEIEHIDNSQYSLFPVYHVLWPAFGLLGHYKNSIFKLRKNDGPGNKKTKKKK